MKINQKYRLLQAFYWMIVCTGCSYTSYYLSNLGYSAGQIGILTASFGVCSVIAQPLLGRVADRSRRFGWKNLLMILATLAEMSFILMLFCSQKLVSGLLAGLVVLLINCMHPMVSAANYYYQKRGNTIDFGVARGMGSLSYAVISMIMGQITVLAGPKSVPAASFLVMAALAAVVFGLPFEKEASSVSTDGRKREKTDTAVRKTGFFGKYPAYSMMLLGSAMLLTFHYLTSTYMIQMLRQVGGDSSNLGTAMAIAAVLELPVMFSFTRLSNKIPSVVLLVIAAASYVGKGVLYLIGGSVSMIYFAQILQMTSYAIYAPAVVKFSDECMSEEDKVTGQAYMSMTSAAGGVIGNLCGGWIIDHMGVGSMLLFGTAFAAAGTVACVISALMLKRQKDVYR